ncbi:hypothetical protein V1L52_02305 [Treponema sp. HNW]|uniref:hypothetical protein n=1 Tax=Treponema sp. HNW TaxID=3116654 RepID=UPI003D0CE983
MSMTETEFNERAAALEQKKKGLERNRNICVLVAVFLGYNAWKSIREGTPPLWFYFAMGAILAGVIAVGVFGHFSSVRAGKEIQDLLLLREKARPGSSSHTEETFSEDGDSEV